MHTARQLPTQKHNPLGYGQSVQISLKFPNTFFKNSMNLAYCSDKLTKNTNAQVKDIMFMH